MDWHAICQAICKGGGAQRENLYFEVEMNKGGQCS